MSLLSQFIIVFMPTFATHTHGTTPHDTSSYPRPLVCFARTRTAPGVNDRLMKETNQRQTSLLTSMARSFSTPADSILTSDRLSACGAPGGGGACGSGGGGGGGGACVGDPTLPTKHATRRTAGGHWSALALGVAMATLAVTMIAYGPSSFVERQRAEPDVSATLIPEYVHAMPLFLHDKTSSAI
jgi:hypothetical protein